LILWHDGYSVSVLSFKVMVIDHDISSAIDCRLVIMNFYITPVFASWWHTWHFHTIWFIKYEI